MEVNVNMNDNVIFYPSESGWLKIKSLITKEYNLSSAEADKWIENRKIDGGYRDQLWSIIEVFHSMFSHGTQFFATTNIKIR